MLAVQSTALDLREAAQRGAVFVVPIAAVEQHGPHLGVGTDTLLATAVGNGTEKRMGDKIVLFPTLPYGSSHHHLDFGGTLSIGAELYTQVLVDLVESMIKWGAKRIVLLNGHGGNIIPGKQALSILMARGHRTQLLAMATYWEVGGSAFFGDKPMETGALTHACEYETSMMMVVCPQAVKLERWYPQKTAAGNSWVGWYNDKPARGVSAAPAFAQMSSHGAMGTSKLATAAKGEHLIDKAVGAMSEFLTEFSAWPVMEDLREKK
jgi:creatinine amidohydrolase